MSFAFVTSRLAVGSDPWSPEDLKKLKNQGITAVLSLQTEEDRSRRGNDWEADAATAEKLLFRNVPVEDFNDHALQQGLPACVSALKGLMDDGHVVYVHCTAGVCRSPTVAVAYLHWCETWPLERAMINVLAVRQCSPSLVAIQGAKWRGVVPEEP
jgi:protein-tyrosine phosphatase